MFVLRFRFCSPLFEVRAAAINRVNVEKRVFRFPFNPFHKCAVFLLVERGDLDFVVILQQIGFMRHRFREQTHDAVVFFACRQRNFNRFANAVDFHRVNRKVRVGVEVTGFKNICSVRGVRQPTVAVERL